MTYKKYVGNLFIDVKILIEITENVDIRSHNCCIYSEEALQFKNRENCFWIVHWYWAKY